MASISFRPRRGPSSEWAMKNPRLGEGGASVTGQTAGAGGDGAQGIVVVITYF